MNSGICEKHGTQKFVLTSPRLAAALAEGKLTKETDLLELKINSLDKIFEYTVDREFLKDFQFNLYDREVTLQDRSKISKQLNDRLTIRKLLREMKWVCPVCLNKIISQKFR